MDCVNHHGVIATAYCQSCGKALCAGCVRNGAGGQLFCAPCWTAWQGFPQPFVPANSGPNPVVAAVFGLIPGVGAMYNGQFFKGLIHVVVFAVLVSITDHYGIFGLFIAAWVLYQSFEAYHTAKARRDGQPLPDPLGLNEVGNWLNLGGRPPYSGQAQANPGPYTPGPSAPGAPSQGPAGQAQGGFQPPYQAPYQGTYQPPYQPGAYQTPFAPPAAGFAENGIPPVPPPIPPLYWKRKEPIGAVILIALGVLFLLGQMDFFSGRLFEFSWPIMLIGMGVWLMIRRLGDSQGGSN
jgi:TM2 domain-containing membrane protein YozV